MPILCEPAADSEELLADLGSEVRTADDLSAAAKLLDSDPAENLVVIGPRAGTEEALGFASALRMVRPAVGVILVRDQTSVELLNQALQSGIREVVQTGDHAALAAACRRSRDVSWRILAATTTERSGPTVDGKIITVFTAKGGVGKTMLSINIGVVLAQRGANKVCVVDLDLASGRRGDQPAARPGADPRGRGLDDRPHRHHRGRIAAHALPGRTGNAAGAGQPG